MSQLRPQTPPTNQPRLLDQVRTTIRLRGMSYQTEKAYADWIKRFIIFHNKRHPKEMGAREIRDFLAHLVNDRDVAPSTQNQALHSLLFLYREVLQIDLVFFRPDKERNSGVHALEETLSIPMSPALVIAAD